MTLWNKIKSVFSAPPQSDALPVTPPEPEQPASVPAKYTRSDREKALIADFRTTHSALLEKLEDAVYDQNLRMK